MSEELYWSGADLVPLSRAGAGLRLRRLFHELAEACSRTLEADGCEDLQRPIRDALERLGTAYRTLDPLLGDLLGLPPSERLSRSPRYGQLVAQVTMMELKLVAELAAARNEWLSRYCRGEE